MQPTAHERSHTPPLLLRRLANGLFSSSVATSLRPLLLGSCRLAKTTFTSDRLRSCRRGERSSRPPPPVLGGGWGQGCKRFPALSAGNSRPGDVVGLNPTRGENLSRARSTLTPTFCASRHGPLLRSCPETPGRCNRGRRESTSPAMLGLSARHRGCLWHRLAARPWSVFSRGPHVDGRHSTMDRDRIGYESVTMSCDVRHVQVFPPVRCTL